MRLIDADALERDGWRMHRTFQKDTHTMVYETKKPSDFPIIEERKRGEWLELTNTNHTYVCSVCGRMLANITDGKNTVTKNYPFCHCGARMMEANQ